MTPLLICAVLGSGIVLNFLLTFALLGRVRALQEWMVAKSSVDAELPRPGDPIGRFEALADDGGTLTDDALSGVTLVGFFSPGCKPCETVKAELVRSPPALPFLAFVDGSGADPSAARRLGEALKAVARVAYTDDASPVLRAFRDPAYPTLVRVENGAVAAAGHRLRDVLA